MLSRTADTTDSNHDFLARVQRLANHISICDSGPFPIFHPDFGYHNFLVDDNYNMLAVIDWGGSAALPLEFTHTFPFNLHSLHEVFWKDGPFDGPLAREQEAQEKIDQAEYVACVEGHESRLRVNHSLSENLGGIRSEVAGCIRMFERRDQNPLAKLLDLVEQKLLVGGPQK